jgi:aryl-alcohol dehydrogenase-like predicted oxidoreductase
MQQDVSSGLIRKRLGRSGLLVSEIGLGTMNFGSQLAEAQCHEVLDAAVDLGITFVDTAEMYASPPTPESYGRSEEIIGRWLARRPRDSVVIGTKIVGPPDGRFQSANHVRYGRATLDRFNIAWAIEGSLKRLGTDYLDLVQFHWPDRAVPWQEQLEAIDMAQRAGKVRYFGCSNETGWGLMRAVACSEVRGLPRPVCVQNVLNWLQQDEYENLQEICREEQIAYIGYSPLAMGLLTGKYVDKLPSGSRFELYDRYRTQYLSDRMTNRVGAFATFARERSVSMAQLALAWALTRPHVTCVLTSASRVEQLRDLGCAIQLARAEPNLTLAAPVDVAGTA